MTAKDHVILWFITIAVVVFVIACLVWSHTNERTTLSGVLNKGKQSMLAKINEYAPIINAVTVFASFLFVIWTSHFRKTRRDRIDELKVEIQIKLDSYWMKQIIKAENPDRFFESLSPKFQKTKYSLLHRCAFDELGYENKNWAFLFLEDIKRVGTVYKEKSHKI